MVEGRLEARDAIGQKGMSAPFSFRLPARVFTDPLARALIEQRQHLATADAAGRKIVMLTLDALTIDPERFYQGKNDIFLALRSAFNGVKNAKSEADITRVEDLLWQTALKLERGGLLSAAEELRKLQMMLTAALASGAPQEVIDELLKRYNEAMQRYVDAMAANPPAARRAAASVARHQDIGHERCADTAEDDPETVPGRRPPESGAAAGHAAIHAGKHAHEPERQGRPGHAEQGAEREAAEDSAA